MRSESYGNRRRRVQLCPGYAILLAVMLLGMAAPSAAQSPPVKIVALGDSLTAGYGLPGSAAFPVRLQAALAAKGLAVEITNAGVSGDTTTDGLARVDWSVPDGTDGVILELGANDALRGLDPDVARSALDKIVADLRSRNIAVLLAGMRAPPNMGQAYTAKFDAIYPALARKYDVPLYPFFLDGVAADRSLNQRDGIHPTAQGVDVIVGRMAPMVEQWVRQIAAAKARSQG